MVLVVVVATFCLSLVFGFGPISLFGDAVLSYLSRLEPVDVSRFCFMVVNENANRVNGERLLAKQF